MINYGFLLYENDHVMEDNEIITYFRNSLKKDVPDQKWPKLTIALWLDGKGDWEGAHDIVQDDNSDEAAWIHAYLHRKEGDNWNADYWYRRAGKSRPLTTLEEEWASLVQYFAKK